MGGGKGGGDSVARQEQGYASGYAAYNPREDVQAKLQAGGGTHTNLAQGYMAGWQDAAGRAAPTPAFRMPDFGKMLEGIGKQQAAQAAENARLQEEYLRQQEIARGTATLDQLFSGRLEAAGRASSEVEKQISDEFSHAQTRGLDYSVDDVQKQERINNLFAEYWGEGQEAEFSEYSSKFATDRHKWTLPTVRGVGPSSSGALPDAVKVGGKVQSGKGTVITDDETLADDTILGG